MSVRVARITPPGSGAIATVAVVGTGAWGILTHFFRLANGRQLTDPPLPGSLHFWRFGPLVGDEVVLAHRPNTREPWFEVHCHGGREVVAWIVEHLTGRGAIPVAWTELDRQQSRSWIRAAAAEELTQALTLKTASILLAQQQGALDQTVQTILPLIETMAIADATLLLQRLLATSKIGLRLTQPFRIAFFGPPNVGKSSLINRIVGYERALISSIPGTTRELTTVLAAIGGWPVELYDSPGIRTPGDELEAEGLRRSTTALKTMEFDLVVWMVDNSNPASGVESFANSANLIVFNKCDLTPGSVSTATSIPSVRVSAISGEGLPELLNEIVDLLVGDVALEQGVLFTEDLAVAITRVLEIVSRGQLQRSQHVLQALIQPEKPQFSILLNESGI